jgi:hypothetical protein
VKAVFFCVPSAHYDIKNLLVDSLRLALPHLCTPNGVGCFYDCDLSENLAARGACLLSAAELSSSKQYIQSPDDSWTLAYQVRTL